MARSQVLRTAVQRPGAFTMTSTPTTPVGSTKPVSPAVLPSNSDTQTTERSTKPTAIAPQIVPKQTGYGMPCANCKTYYAADLNACPVCKGGERISPTAVPMRSTVSATELYPDSVALE